MCSDSTLLLCCIREQKVRIALEWDFLWPFLCRDSVFITIAAYSKGLTRTYHHANLPTDRFASFERGQVKCHILRMQQFGEFQYRRAQEGFFLLRCLTSSAKQATSLGRWRWSMPNLYHGARPWRLDLSPVRRVKIATTQKDIKQHDRYHLG